MLRRKKPKEEPKPEEVSVPDYFSGSNPTLKDDEKKDKEKVVKAQVYPDPTGNGSGTWAIPAGDKKGGHPQQVDDIRCLR